MSLPNRGTPGRRWLDVFGDSGIRRRMTVVDPETNERWTVTAEPMRWFQLVDGRGRRPRSAANKIVAGFEPCLDDEITQAIAVSVLRERHRCRMSLVWCGGWCLFESGRYLRFDGTWGEMDEETIRYHEAASTLVQAAEVLR